MLFFRSATLGYYDLSGTGHRNLRRDSPRLLDQCHSRQWDRCVARRHRRLRVQLSESSLDRPGTAGTVSDLRLGGRGVWWRCLPRSHSPRPVGRAFNRNANGVRASVHGWRLGRREDLWRCLPHSHSPRPVGPAVKRGRQRRAPSVHGLRLGRRKICGVACRARTAGPVGPAVKRGRQRRAHRYTVCVWDGQRFVALPAALAQLRGPLGLRLNGDANGVRASVHGWRLGRREDCGVACRTRTARARGACG